MGYAGVDHHHHLCSCRFAGPSAPNRSDALAACEGRNVRVVVGSRADSGDVPLKSAVFTLGWRRLRGTSSSSASLYHVDVVVDRGAVYKM